MVRVPVRLKSEDPALVGPAVERFRAGAASSDDLRLLTKHLLALLVTKAPGGAVEGTHGCAIVAWPVAGQRHLAARPATSPRTSVPR